jgi:hypothetical protein
MNREIVNLYLQAILADAGSVQTMLDTNDDVESIIDSVEDIQADAERLLKYLRTLSVSR